MNTTLWITQGFLSLLFLYSGLMKSTQKREKLVSIGQTGVADISYPFIRFIGISEILGAFGIILPQALGIAPVLTVVTAVCFGVIMAFAIPIHYRRREFKSVALNIFILLASVFVATGRG